MNDIDKLSNILRSANLAAVSRETKLSRHNLSRIIRKDRTVTLEMIETLKEYYGV